MVISPLSGQLVLFRINENEVRPALIVRPWSEHCANLLVFPDGSNDGAHVNYEANSNNSHFIGGQVAGIWKTSVPRGPGVGQWQTFEDAASGAVAGDGSCTHCQGNK